MKFKESSLLLGGVLLLILLTSLSVVLSSKKSGKGSRTEQYSAEEAANELKELQALRSRHEASVRRTDSMLRVYDSIEAVRNEKIRLEPEAPEDKWRAQWTTFRKNPAANRMKDIKMKLKVFIKFRDRLKAEIDGDMSYGVWVIPMTYDAYDSPIKMEWSDAEAAGIFPSIAQEDWITVEGKFLNVADDGKLNVIPKRIINHGP